MMQQEAFKVQAEGQKVHAEPLKVPKMTAVQQRLFAELVNQYYQEVFNAQVANLVFEAKVKAVQKGLM